MTTSYPQEEGDAGAAHAGIYTLAYRRLGPLALQVPVDWAMDPFNVLNWRHHLLSLRWMDVLAPATLRAFLADFHDFHFVRKQANSMVGTANGDHTTTIRLEYLGTFRAVFQGQGDRKGVILCERLMRGAWSPCCRRRCTGRGTTMA